MDNQMGDIKNILFIMFDQLRFDYLSCAGHPTLSTPNIDRLAERSLRFTRAYVQSPICGSSRMSFYTGRYVHSHGAQRNGFPLKVGEITLGDHLRSRGMDAYLLGKTHMRADAKGLERLGIAADSIIGVRVSECGFDPIIRDDGLWGEGPDGPSDPKAAPYNAYLKEKRISWDQSLEPVRQRWSDRGGSNRVGLADGKFPSAGERARGGLRDAMADVAMHRFS